MRRGRERRGERERERIIFHVIVSFPGHRACVHGDRLVLLHSTTQGPNILDICGHGWYSLSGSRDEGGTGEKNFKENSLKILLVPRPKKIKFDSL